MRNDVLPGLGAVRARAAEGGYPEDPRRVVADVFTAKRARLLALPDNLFAREERGERQVGTKRLRHSAARRRLMQSVELGPKDDWTAPPLGSATDDP